MQGSFCDSADVSARADKLCQLPWIGSTLLANCLPTKYRHRVDLAKVEVQQPNRLRPFFSALETFFFAGVSEWNLKKIWINSKKLQPYQFRMVLNGPVGTLPPIGPRQYRSSTQNSFNAY